MKIDLSWTTIVPHIVSMLINASTPYKMGDEGVGWGGGGGL
jgi:hypothetical protein